MYIQICVLTIKKILNDYKTPCAENGYIAGQDHVIPEYNYKTVTSSPYGVKLSEAVIYKVSPDGTERMAAYWNIDKKKFIEIGSGD